ncbi:MAG: hypothetical protein Q4G58_04045 [bacterium]|nr:hypothetical protein [bacterium]
MKVVLSRKGFDMKHGRIPSPILPDGTLLLLPRPSEEGYVRYDELFYNGTSYLEIIRSLNPTIAEELKDAKCFPNPDLTEHSYKKESNWKANFTQYGPSEGHLSSQRISVGDIFLFFGWFKQTEINEENQLTYVKNAPDLHIIFSYLQIGAIIKNKNYILKKYKWHNNLIDVIKSTKHYSIYLPTKKLSYNNRQSGYGQLKFSDKLVLTKQGLPCSKWDLPDLFRRPDVTISYHNNYTNGFIPGKDYFQSSNIGQEFVINGTHDLKAWVCHLIYSKKLLRALHEDHTMLGQVNHINYADSDGYIYCRKHNKVMKVDSTACKLCQCFNSLICNTSVECYWTDYMPEPQEICKVENPSEEFKRVNWLIDKQFIPNL